MANEWDASEQPWNTPSQSVSTPPADIDVGGPSADSRGNDDELRGSFRRPSPTVSESDILGDMRANQYKPMDVEDFRLYRDKERMEQLAQLGMLDMSGVPTEGVPPMLAREGYVPPSISDEELFLLAKEPGVPLPGALMFQSTASGKTEMDLMPQESRASIGRAGRPVIYDPAVKGAQAEPWSFFDMPDPIQPEQVYGELKTDVERYNFLKRRKSFVGAFNERKEDFEQQSEIAGYALGGAGALVGFCVL